MKSDPLGSRLFTRVFLVANAVFWLVFAVYFVDKSQAYQPHPLKFEEVTPLYIFWGRGLPFDHYMSPFMRAARFIEAPSFYAARPFFWYFNTRNITADHLFASVSVDGYYLLLVCLLSFGFWCLAGWLIDYLVLSRHLSGRRDSCSKPRG